MFDARSFMRDTKPHFEKCQSHGITFTGQIHIHTSNALLISPVTIRKGVATSRGNLVILSENHWEIRGENLSSLCSKSADGIHKILMPNLVQFRNEETEEKSVARLKAFLLKVLIPKNREIYPVLAWTEIRLSTRFIHPPLRLFEENGLAS